MIHREARGKRFSPRSGRNENSPALQCWVYGGTNFQQPVKRATENIVGRLVRKVQPSASRTKGGMSRIFPSDESLGYFQSSASRTILMSLASITFCLAFTSSSALAQTPSPSSTPDVSPQQQVSVPPIAVDYRADTTRPMPPLTRVGVDATEQQPLSLREAIALALQNNRSEERRVGKEC